MTFDPRTLPDFTKKSVVDRHMERLDTHGVSRRDFLSFASAAAVAAASAKAFGLGQVALADGGDKLAYLSGYLRNEWNVQFSDAIQEAGRQFGYSYTALDSQIDGQRQYNQFEEQVVAGANGMIFNLSDGAAIRRIAGVASREQIFVANIWDSLPWFTPFEAGDYWTLYAQPEEFSAQKALTEVLLKRVTEEFGGGKIAAVTGNPGNTLDTLRSRGTAAAFAAYPQTELVDSLPGLWNREDSLRAAEDLLTRHGDIVGFVGHNDDVAQGILAALRTNGLKAGQDVFVAATDATLEGATAVRNGLQISTSANSPPWAGGFFVARLYDVQNGWEPRPIERLLSWRSVLLTQDNIDSYFGRYVDNNGVAPFDYQRMSKVLHPDDWDPQNEVFPLDVDILWDGLPKPDGWQYPKEYTEARANGDWEAVTAEYAEHYQVKFIGPSPNA